MKKLFTAAVCIISCALLALSALTRPALAEDTARFKIDSADGLSAGDTFTVGLNISGTYNIHVINLAVSFDPKALELTDVQNGELLNTVIPDSSGFYVLEYKSIAKDGFVKLGLAMPTDALTANGEMFKMTFKVLDGVAVNQQIFVNIYELAYMPIGAKEGTPIRFETENAIVKINGASDPEGGFISGASGTQNPAVTQVPTVNNTADQPDSTDDQGAATEVPGGTSGADSTPNGTVDPAASATPNAVKDPDANGKTDGDGVKPVVYILIAAVAVAAIAAVVVIVKKKKTGGEE